MISNILDKRFRKPLSIIKRKLIWVIIYCFNDLFFTIPKQGAKKKPAKSMGLLASIIVKNEKLAPSCLVQYVHFLHFGQCRFII